ncbi:MAG TPA: DUF2240 family protein [Thermoplasmata archaeon]|nr:DUF2240 family protein [Thermoplasmata archaeon]
MFDEMKQVITFLFKRAGKTSMTKTEFYLDLSMHLRWCPVDLAKRFLENSITLGLLKEDEGMVSPTFPMKDVFFPINFKPSPDLFRKKIPSQVEEKKEGIRELIPRLVETLGVTCDAVTAEIEKIEREKNVFNEVAVLMCAHEHGLEVSKYFDEVFNVIIKSEASKAV